MVIIQRPGKAPAGIPTRRRVPVADLTLPDGREITGEATLVAAQRRRGRDMVTITAGEQVTNVELSEGQTLAGSLRNRSGARESFTLVGGLDGKPASTGDHSRR